MVPRIGRTRTRVPRGGHAHALVAAQPARSTGLLAGAGGAHEVARTGRDGRLTCVDENCSPGRSFLVGLTREEASTHRHMHTRKHIGSIPTACIQLLTLTSVTDVVPRFPWCFLIDDLCRIPLSLT